MLQFLSRTEILILKCKTVLTALLISSCLLILHCLHQIYKRVFHHWKVDSKPKLILLLPKHGATIYFLAHVIWSKLKYGNRQMFYNPKFRPYQCNAQWANECHFAKIGFNRVKNCCIRVKFVAILLPSQKCYSFFSSFNHKGEN